MADSIPAAERQRPDAVISWALLLHFYQPPHQTAAILRRVVEESYLPLIEVFRKRRHARVSVNICGVLTEMLWESGYREVITGLRDLAERGQIEFTGSGKYHPILPLIPEDERMRQISRNFLTNQHFFGDVYEPRGFFPPELAYSSDLVRPVIESRHQWMLLSGVACPVPWTTTLVHQVPCDEDSLAVLFRDDILSNKISFHTVDARGFIEETRRLAGGGRDAYVVTAMDAETFGHHIPGWEDRFLSAAFGLVEPGAPDGPPRLTLPDNGPGAALAAGKHPVRRGAAAAAVAGETAPQPVQSVTLSDLLDRFPQGQQLQPKASSWSTSADDLYHGNYYPLWDDPNNALHKLLWKHLRLAIDLVGSAESLADNDPSRQYSGIGRALLDQALHSCQFWWASRRPMWEINMVHRGLLQQQEAVLNAVTAIRTSNARESAKEPHFYKFAASRDLCNRVLDLLINT